MTFFLLLFLFSGFFLEALALLRRFIVYRDGKIEISLKSIGKFLGISTALSAMLAAAFSLIVMAPPINGWSVERQMTEVVATSEKGIVVEIQETPGFMLDLLEDEKRVRYIRTARNGWYAYETGFDLEKQLEQQLERIYTGYKLRQQADEILAGSVEAQPQTQAVTDEPESDSVGSAASPETINFLPWETPEIEEVSPADE